MNGEDKTLTSEFFHNLFLSIRVWVFQHLNQKNILLITIYKIPFIIPLISPWLNKQNQILHKALQVWQIQK